LSFAIIAIVGAVRSYSPVPLADMWDGYLQFYIDLTKGYLQEWYGAGNEHRFIFSRLMFWLDIRCFGGLSIFLIAANLVLMALLWSVFCFVARSLLGARNVLLVPTCALLLVPCFSWLQSENITWAFQSQFFLAYLFPLFAFLCFAKSLGAERPRAWFAAATAWGCLSLGTMANGTLVLPLLIAAVVVSGTSVRPRLAVLVPLSALMLFLYFQDFPPSHGFSASWAHRAKFALEFLGAPIGIVLMRDNLAEIAGALFLAAAVAMFIAWYRSTARDPMMLALLAFLAYIVLTSAAAAIGRANDAATTDFASRYETPALLGWSALALLLIAQFRDRLETRGALAVVAVLVPIALLRPQLDALGDDGPHLVRLYRMGALALDLGVNDEDACQYLYPHDVPRIAATTAEACERNISVFGMPDLVLARTSIGRRADELGLVECTGHVDRLVPVPGDKGRFKAIGWALDPGCAKTPDLVLIGDPDGTILGAAYTGVERSDIASQYGESRLTSGFEGYVRRGASYVFRVFAKR
jgi:hypothetical protein